MVDTKTSKDTADKYRAPALEKGLDIIELLAQYASGLSQAEIAKALDRSPNEIYRMLTTLVRRQYVSRSLEGDRFQLSLKMFSLSNQHPPVNRLLEAALPMLRKTSKDMHQSSHIGMEHQGEIVIVASVEAPSNWSFVLKTGSVIGLWNTGTGRAIAAFQNSEMQQLMFNQHERALGEPEMSLAQFRDILGEVRAQGHVRMPSASTVGVTNLAFPILGPNGDAVAALSCPFMERIDDFKAPGIEEVQQTFAQVAQDITSIYGSTPT
ncbi:IclR family transcriptional regulator [Pseudovibrio sp. Tun.PSC04-5.I4]|uniref:IclR family transcriptional regulator n=1 Tax=Pseudovibrio sp. Tun.PSC04-5.I4 TaxID=1798213 RepID=UPI000888DDB1|nr:IclR family transcriptional regulator [Pseudovibrio sp. Tun.PSC04-5.I4]SDR29692.1 DNA-binding transcriptional regulator, IclR family [Pseudovibrio sp. Tun.PSC04-5.I4]